MNRVDYYPGDWLKDTVMLTLAQDGAYHRLADQYYATEQPIRDDEKYRAARCETKADREATDFVLKKYFIRNGDVWVHRVIEANIEKALPKIEAARTNGRRGGRKGTHLEPSGLPAGFQVGEPKTVDSVKLPPPPPDPKENRSDPKPPVHRDRLPSTMVEILSIEPNRRASLLLENEHEARWASPHTWPEVIEAAQAIHAGLGFSKSPQLGQFGRDKGVNRIVEMFAAGFTLDEIKRAAPRMKDHKFLGKARSLQAVTVGVLRDLVSVDSDTKASAENTWDND